ncbi:MAG: DUF3999 family protein [Candidatus Omnitrophota bacterium]|jgi:hypothetical protein
MLRRISAALTFAVLFISASPLLCDITAKYWEFEKQILITDYSKKAAAVLLDKEVYDSAREDLGDLRVLDPKGQEHPYDVIIHGDMPTGQKLALNVISNDIGQTESVITVELKEPLKPFNYLKVVPASNNFARKITVEGSNDNRNWEVIRKGIVVYSFAFQMTHTFFEQYTHESYYGYGFGTYTEENLAMRVPQKVFKFVRVIVPHDQDKEPVELKSLDIFRTVEAAPEEYSFSATLIKTETDAASKSVESIADLGSKNIPLSRIDIAVDGSNFFRRVEIEGSNDLKKWNKLARDVIFSIAVDDQVETKTTIKLGKAKARYIKVKVFNGDNKPISLVSLTGYSLKRYLVIIPEQGVEYKLLYGNRSAKALNYDLGAVIKGKTIESFGKGSLAGQVRNVNYEPYKELLPWTEDKPYILWIAMGAIILGLIYLGSQVVNKTEKK